MSQHAFATLLSCNVHYLRQESNNRFPLYDETLPDVRLTSYPFTFNQCIAVWQHCRYLSSTSLKAKIRKRQKKLCSHSDALSHITGDIAFKTQYFCIWTLMAVKYLQLYWSGILNTGLLPVLSISTLKYCHLVLSITAFWLKLTIFPLCLFSPTVTSHSLGNYVCFIWISPQWQMFGLLWDLGGCRARGHL